MVKRIVALLIVLCAFGLGFLAGSSNLHTVTARLLEEGPTAFLDQSQLTEKQVIDILVEELDSLTWRNYGCLECKDDWRNPPSYSLEEKEKHPEISKYQGMDNDLWSDAYNNAVKGDAGIGSLVRHGDNEGVYKHTWTAEYAKDGWWLVSAKQLGYWILNEDKELAMSCKVFSKPTLMRLYSESLDENAPAARGICESTSSQ